MIRLFRVIAELREEFGKLELTVTVNQKGGQSITGQVVFPRNIILSSFDMVWRDVGEKLKVELGKEEV